MGEFWGGKKGRSLVASGRISVAGAGGTGKVAKARIKRSKLRSMQKKPNRIKTRKIIANLSAAV